MLIVSSFASKTSTPACWDGVQRHSGSVGWTGDWCWNEGVVRCPSRHPTKKDNAAVTLVEVVAFLLFSIIQRRSQKPTLDVVVVGGCPSHGTRRSKQLATGIARELCLEHVSRLLLNVSIVPVRCWLSCFRGQAAWSSHSWCSRSSLCQRFLVPALFGTSNSCHFSPNLLGEDLKKLRENVRSLCHIYLLYRPKLGDCPFCFIITMWLRTYEALRMEKATPCLPKRTHLRKLMLPALK